MNNPRCVLSALTLGICLQVFSGCGGSLQTKRQEQGIQGVFTTYGPPEQTDCSTLTDQAEKDSCRIGNERMIDTPFQGTITVENLATQEKKQVELDAEGKYQLRLVMGQYAVCVKEECSDPLEIRMGVFTVYGQRFPRPEKPSETGLPKEPKAEKAH